MAPASFLPALLLAALAACGTAPAGSGPAAAPGPAAPGGAPPGTCWNRHATPAVIETVTHQVLVRPAGTAAGGSVPHPPAYRTETRQDIVTPRRESWIETPCPGVMTAEFTASLQRALAARGHYHGPISGDMDARTRAAVRRYQQPQGLDSGILSLAAARRLGLVAIPREGAAKAAG